MSSLRCRPFLRLRPSSSLRTLTPRSSTPITASQLSTPTYHFSPILSRRHLHASTALRKGLQPDSADPQPPNATHLKSAKHTPKPATITTEEYHEIADTYIDALVLTLEDKIERGESGFEVEYSAGVMNLATPSGTYVINKQPPNKQLWISSPRSGPKRFDWVLVLKGGAQSEKQETGLEREEDLQGGHWVYLRDGSTLAELLKKELDVVIDFALEGDR